MLSSESIVYIVALYLPKDIPDATRHVAKARTACVKAQAPQVETDPRNPALSNRCLGLKVITTFQAPLVGTTETLEPHPFPFPAGAERPGSLISSKFASPALPARPPLTAAHPRNQSNC